jgi:hypothetical protein
MQCTETVMKCTLGTVRRLAVHGKGTHFHRSHENARKPTNAATPTLDVQSQRAGSCRPRRWTARPGALPRRLDRRHLMAGIRSPCRSSSTATHSGWTSRRSSSNRTRRAWLPCHSTSRKPMLAGICGGSNFRRHITIHSQRLTRGGCRCRTKVPPRRHQ